MPEKGEGKLLRDKIIEALIESEDLDERRTAVRAAIVAATGVDEAWITGFYDDYAVYEQDNGKLFKVDYTIAVDETVSLGQPAAVKREVSYQPVVAATEADVGGVAEFTETGELVEVGA